MTLAELYEIGKTSRSAAGSLKRASAAAAPSSFNGDAGRRRKPLVVEVVDDDDDDYEEKKAAARAIGASAGEGATGDGQGTLPKGRPTCMICRERESRYNCPNCNIAYCSLQCYQDASRHATCSQTFLRDTLRTELGRSGNDGNGKETQVDEGERKAMMDLLRRFNMSEEGGNLDADVEGDEEGDIEREVVLGDHPEIDLDQASLQQLMSLLSDEERSVFEAGVNDSSQSKAKSLMDRLMRQEEEENVEGEEQQNAATSTFGSKPWWSSTSLTNNHLSSSPVERVSVSDVYDSAVKLSQQPRRQVGKGKSVRLEHNIIGILLGYALVVRHLGVECLSELVIPLTSEACGEENHDADFDDMPPLESSDDQIEDDEAPLSDEERDAMRSVAKAKCTHLLPYLQPVGAESKMVLDSPEDATLSIAARMDNVAGTGTAGGAAAALHFLYKDVLAIVSSPKIVEVTSTAASSTVLPPPRDDRVSIALCDLSLLFDEPVQRKLLFYAAYWLRLDVDAKRKFEEMITAESDRIKKEIDRGEDEERFNAAHQASEQQIGLP